MGEMLIAAWFGTEEKHYFIGGIENESIVHPKKISAKLEKSLT